MVGAQEQNKDDGAVTIIDFVGIRNGRTQVVYSNHYTKLKATMLYSRES